MVAPKRTKEAEDAVKMEKRKTPSSRRRRSEEDGGTEEAEAREEELLESEIHTRTSWADARLALSLLKKVSVLVIVFLLGNLRIRGNSANVFLSSFASLTDRGCKLFFLPGPILLNGFPRKS